MAYSIYSGEQAKSQASKSASAARKQYKAEQARILEQQRIANEEYQRQVAAQEQARRQMLAYFATPVEPYSQEIVDTQYKLGRTPIQEQAGELRKQALENLAVRGVRSSGISEAPMRAIGTQEQKSLNALRTSLTLQELIAARERKQNRSNQQYQYTAGLAAGGTAAPGMIAGANESNYLQALYNQAAVNQQYNQQIAGALGGLGYSLGQLYGGTSTTQTASGGSLPVSLSLYYNPYQEKIRFT